MDVGKGRELGAVSLIVFWRDQWCLQNIVAWLWISLKARDHLDLIRGSIRHLIVRSCIFDCKYYASSQHKADVITLIGNDVVTHQ
jgi:hypothetical protein